MNWFEQLISFYGNNDLPLFHWEFISDIEVMLSEDGEFTGAVLRQEKVIIPVTESSLSRTYGIAPHPVFDTLKYLAGDTLHNKRYLEGLNTWADSEHSTSELRTLRDHLAGNDLAEELRGVGIPAEKYKGALVRFSVGDKKLWQDTVLRNKYISYIKQQDGDKILCCVTGKYEEPAKIHPKRILRPNSSAKLISYNEKDRIISGKAADAAPTFVIGRESSFKAHVVLKRLLEQGGVYYGSRAFVAWDSLGNNVPLIVDMSVGASPCGTVTVMGFDEVSRGRISVTFFRRLSSGEYVTRADVYSSEIGLPADKIALLAFGHRNSDGELSCSNGLLAQTVERILGSILDGRVMPDDIMRKIKRKDTDVYKSLKGYSDNREGQNVCITA